jgi:hypothetical protein
MNATKLAVAGFFTMTLMFAANTQTASAGPYHGRFVHHAYWGHRPICSVAPVYSYAPVTTCVADAAVVPVAPPVPQVVTAPIVTTPVVTAIAPTCTTRVYYGGHRYGFRHWRR